MSLCDDDSPLLLDDVEDETDYEYESVQRYISSAHDEIERKTAQFLAAGGKIEVLPPCHCLDSYMLNTKNREELLASAKIGSKKGAETISGRSKKKKLTELTPVTIFAKANDKRYRTSKSGRTNIILRDNRYSVIISGMQYGSFDKEGDAVNKRDSVRAILGMAPADY